MTCSLRPRQAARARCCSSATPPGRGSRQESKTYSRSFGDTRGDGFGEGFALRDVVRGGIPLGLDLGYRLAPELYAGVSGSYAFLFPSGCASGANCSGRDVRLGVDLRFHLAPRTTVDPWIGVGAGYEWLLLSATPGGLDQHLTLRGFEFFNVQLGVDLLAIPRFWVGPFVDFSLGRYSNGSVSSALVAAPVGNFPATQPFPGFGDKKLHEWLQIGFRAAFSP
jgi:hypothetical protein